MNGRGSDRQCIVRKESVKSVSLPSKKTLKGILQEHGHGHWSDPFGNRSNFATLFLHVFKVDITNEARARGAFFSINAHIDDHTTFSHHVSSDKTGSTDSSNKNIGLAGEFGKVLGVAVSNSYGGIAVRGFLDQKGSEGFAYNIAPSNDHNMLLLDLNLSSLE